MVKVGPYIMQILFSNENLCRFKGYIDELVRRNIRFRIDIMKNVN